MSIRCLRDINSFHGTWDEPQNPRLLPPCLPLSSHCIRLSPCSLSHGHATVTVASVQLPEHTKDVPSTCLFFCLEFFPCLIPTCFFPGYLSFSSIRCNAHPRQKLSCTPQSKLDFPWNSLPLYDPFTSLTFSLLGIIDSSSCLVMTCCPFYKTRSTKQGLLSVQPCIPAEAQPLSWGT